ncbi:MAG: DNA translocase FtsK 4TM domain-containing protein [Acutalibacter sp.]
MPANAKKNTSSTKKKPASKRTPPASSTRSTRKSSTNSRGGKRQQDTHLTAEAIRQKNQIRAVVLFACAILLGCLVLIPGDNLWHWAHNAILGLFGSWALLWPVLMIYVAVITAMEKPRGSIGGKVWMTVAVIVLFCATGFIFGSQKIPSGLNFWQYIVHLYTENSGTAGGVVGGLLGLPLVRAAGQVGARIIIVLLLFVAVMILTGTTLVGLFRTIKRPVDMVSEGLESARLRREEERMILERDAQIDVPLEDQMPAHPVRADTPAGLFQPPPEKKKAPQKNEKLERLKAAFGMEESPQPRKLETAEQPAAEPVSAVAVPQEQPSPAEKQVEEGTQALERALEEIEEMHIPLPPVETVRSPQPKEAAAVSASSLGQPSEKPPVPDEVRELTTKFMEQKEQNDRKEATPAQQALYQAADPAKTYCFPPVSMLAVSPQGNPSQETEELQTNGRILVDTLKSFGVQTKILDICRGPAVTRYEIQPAAGVKISKITNLSDDLALNLAATGVRIEAPIPGKAAVGIEVPNKSRSTVRMRELVESNSFQSSKSKLSVALGRDIAGQPVIADLAKMPHLLIAGTTGSGKSVCINSLIISMLYKATPDEVRFLMIDPKAVELTEYNGMPHMLVPVVTDPRKASGALGWAVSEMMKRYKIFSECNVRNLKGYNALAESQNYQDENGQPMPAMPQIVIIIDELADLMMAAPKEVEDSICRLAQLARAAGMHLVVATQRPSVDVVTGLIKANIPSRIALTVSNAVDSRTILDAGGAEKLLGNGDMLFAPVGATKPLRVQGCFVTDEEISSIVEFVKKTKTMDYDKKVIEEIERNAASESKGDDSGDNEGGGDPMIDEAIKCVVEAGQASTSLLQRRLRLGYARAGRLIDEMEQLGVVGPHEGSKPRQVLMTYAQWMERNMQKSGSSNEEE